MTKFELTEFLTWMTNHQPSSKQVMDEMYVHDVALVMQTVRDEFTRLQAERDEARQQVENIKNGFEGGCYLCEVVGEMNKRLQAERDAALAVVNEFVSDTTSKNQTPDHECEFLYNPETGKCDACEAWGNYVGLFCSREDEDEEEETL